MSWFRIGDRVELLTSHGMLHKAGIHGTILAQFRLDDFRGLTIELNRVLVKWDNCSCRIADGRAPEIIFCAEYPNDHQFLKKIYTLVSLNSRWETIGKYE